MLSRVDLPDPEGPTTATSSPGYQSDRDVAQGRHLLAASTEESVQTSGLEDRGRVVQSTLHRILRL